MEVPVCVVYPPPGAVLNILTAGAQRSGFVFLLFENPCPENGANTSSVLSYPLTLITEDAVEGIVKVISEEGDIKPVAELVVSLDGSQNCNRPSVILPVGIGVTRKNQVPEVINCNGISESLLSGEIVLFGRKERKYCRNGWYGVGLLMVT